MSLIRKTLFVFCISSVFTKSSALDLKSIGSTVMNHTINVGIGVTGVAALAFLAKPWLPKSPLVKNVPSSRHWICVSLAGIAAVSCNLHTVQWIRNCLKNS